MPNCESQAAISSPWVSLICYLAQLISAVYALCIQQLLQISCSVMSCLMEDDDIAACDSQLGIVLLQMYTKQQHIHPTSPNTYKYYQKSFFSEKTGSLDPPRPF